VVTFEEAKRLIVLCNVLRGLTSFFQVRAGIYLKIHHSCFLLQLSHLFTNHLTIRREATCIVDRATLNKSRIIQGCVYDFLLDYLMTMYEVQILLGYE